MRLLNIVFYLVVCIVGVLTIQYVVTTPGDQWFISSAGGFCVGSGIANAFTEGYRWYNEW